MRMPKVLVVLLAAALALLFVAGCGTSSSCSRTTTNNDAAVVRVYAKAIALSERTNDSVTLHFAGSHYVGRDVWIVRFSREKGTPPWCIALELDRISLSAITANKPTGAAHVDCSEFTSHK
jgi:hypothetical protein